MSPHYILFEGREAGVVCVNERKLQINFDLNERLRDCSNSFQNVVNYYCLAERNETWDNLDSINSLIFKNSITFFFYK